jgi:adenosine deaminase
MGLEDLKQIILSGFKSAFMPFHVKQQYLRKVSEELAAFTEARLEAEGVSARTTAVA